MQSPFLKKTVKPLIFSASTLLFTIIGMNSVYAENITIRTAIGQQIGDSSIDRPRNGLKKADVKRIYGNPESRRSSVGAPPISSWVYPHYTVYFENNVVIHSVLTR